MLFSVFYANVMQKYTFLLKKASFWFIFFNI